MRYGRLAAEMSDRGFDVLRVLPTFSHFGRFKRQVEDGQKLNTEAGELLFIECGEYSNSRSLARLRFLRKFGQRVSEIDELHEYDVVVLASPPLSAARRIAASDVLAQRTILDIRDIWPDALVATLPFAVPEPIAVCLRKALTRRLDRFAGIVLTSPEFAAWKREIAPDLASRFLPIGSGSEFSDRISTRAREDNAVFVGSLSHHFQFDDCLDGWRIAKRQRMIPEHSSLLIAGDGALRDHIEKVTANADDISTLGWIEADQAELLMRTSTVGIAPYAATSPVGLGNKLFEYAAAGLHVVGSMGAKPSATFLEQEPWFLNVGTADEWAAGFSSALSHPRSNEALDFARRNNASGMTDTLIEYIREIGL